MSHSLRHQWVRSISQPRRPGEQRSASGSLLLQRRLRLCRSGALLAVWLLAIVADAHAANRRWNNNTGSFVFNTGGNWVGGVTPGVLDVAQFGLSGFPFSVGPYTVSFNNNATNQALHIEDDSVTFNLNSRVYTLTAATGMVVGNQSGGFSGSLTVTNGTISGSTNFDVGAVANRSGTLIVGTNGLISGSPTLNIGKVGTGTLTVQADGDISSTGATNIGVGDGITGTATIFGNGTAGSATLVTGTLNVGSIGDGTVNVQFGGLLQNNGGARLGTGSLFTGVGIGIVNVMNASSVWNSVGLLEVGDGGTGEVNITLGGKMTGVNTEIGSSSSGEVNVDGLGSLWDSSGTVTVGQLGAGTLNITNQGVVEDTDGVIGNSSLSGSTGTVAVTGAGSQWVNSDELMVGVAGTGSLNITIGGTVRDRVGFVGRIPGGVGNVTVNGTGSLWDNSDRLSVGYEGEGTLSITAGGIVQSTEGIVGDQGAGSTGHVTVDGAGSLWENSELLSVGNFGEGTLTISNGGNVHSVAGVLGEQAVGHITVNGDGSLWQNNGGFTIGHSGQGMLEITGGGRVHSSTSTLLGVTTFNRIGKDAEGTGHVRVDGDGSRWENFGPGKLFIGERGDATLEITAGGVVLCRESRIGVEPGSTGHVTVDGDGSLWANENQVPNGGGTLFVGDDGAGTLEITDGGLVQNVDGYLGGDISNNVSSGTGLVTVDGDGSRWLNTGTLTIGYVGTGTLHITNAGKVTVDSDASIGLKDGSTGTVTVSSTIAGAESAWEIGGRLWIGFSDFSPVNGVGTLRIQPGGKVTVTEDTVVALDDLLSLEGGTLTTSGISFANGGSVGANFQWTSGTLHVGVFQSNLTNSAGILAPGNSIGATAIQGNYNQLTNATLEIEIGPVGQGAQNDSVSVTGTSTIDGQLSLSLINGAAPLSGQTFIILDAATLAGSFDNVTSGQRLTTTDGFGSFVVNYGAGSAFNPNQVVLSNFLSTAGVPGDYNGNGVVEAADYVIWRKNVGTTNSLPNDPIGGTIGPPQYNQWRAHFGQTAGSGSGVSANSTVPEPTALVMLIVAVAGWHLWRGRPESKVPSTHQCVKGFI